MIDISYWFMFPVGVLISTIAMMSGLGGAIFFSPFFILVLRLEPLLALASGLFIEMFGFSSGVIGYIRAKLVDWHIVKRLMFFAIFAAIIGVILSKAIPVWTLKILLSGLMIYLAASFLFFGKKCEAKDCESHKDMPKHKRFAEPNNSVKYSTFLGGLLMGMISSGLGEINEYNFLKRMKLSVPVASATSVFLVAISAIVGVIAHALFLVSEGDFGAISESLSIIVFTVPAVIIGAQIGVRLSRKIDSDLMEKMLGIIFAVMSIATIFTLLI